MDNSSFREILAQFLEEKSENSTLKTSSDETPKAFHPEPTPLLQWTAPEIKLMKKNGYPPAPARKTATVRAEKPARPTPIEKIFALNALQPMDQDAVGTLIHLGAIELRSAISLLRLKRAHRRIAKALHPDRIPQNLSEKEKDQRREQFLMLQAAYECLSRSLRNMEANDLASGNGSASGSDSQRQDAA